MSDTQPPADPEPVQPPPPPVPVAPPVERTRLRDRLFGLRALIAVALAGVILGGLAGFGVHAATDGDGRMGRFGPGGPDGGFGGPGQMGPGHMGPGQMGPGQMGPGQMGPGGQLPPQGGNQQQPTPAPSQDS